MELSRWNVQEYEITDGEGERAAILFRPLTHGWRTRHLETSLELQRAAERVSEVQADDSGDGSVSAEQIERLLRAQADAQKTVDSFRKSLFSDLVVGSKNITVNGESPSPQVLVETILSLEDLSEDLSNHMLSLGQVSEPEGKS